MWHFFTTSIFFSSFQMSFLTPNILYNIAIVLFLKRLRTLGKTWRKWFSWGFVSNQAFQAIMRQLRRLRKRIVVGQGKRLAHRKVSAEVSQSLTRWLGMCFAALSINDNSQPYCSIPNGLVSWRSMFSFNQTLFFLKNNLTSTQFVKRQRKWPTIYIFD